MRPVALWPVAVLFPERLACAGTKSSARSAATAARGRGIRIFAVHQALNSAPFGVVGSCKEADGVAFCAGARGAADAVDVVFWHLRHVVIDDMRDMWNVEAARRDIGCHQNAVFLVTEILDDAVAPSLLQIAVDSIGMMLVFVQFGGQFFGAKFGFDEDDDGAFARVELFE